jgi:DNA repair exonuclease SbcCD ATPase subunit
VKEQKRRLFERRKILMEKSDFASYRMLVKEVKQLKEQLEALEASLYSPKGQRFTTTPRATNGTGNTMDAAVERHLELMQLYEDKLAEKESRQLSIEMAIESLEDTAERVVMRDRYLCGRSWRSIVMKLADIGYSERQVYRLHGFALFKLKEI